MALSEEVLQTIAYAREHGYDKLNRFRPEQTREMMKLAPQNENPTVVGQVINMVIEQDEIPVRIYIPEGDGPFPVISYFHGGGFVLMSLDTHDEICRQICVNTGAIVMSVDYKLAPEHPYPAGPESCVAATLWMIENATRFNGIPERMAVAGDSAGGYMALYVAQKLTAAGVQLKAQFAAYPVTDHYTADHASWDENRKDYVLTAQLMQWFWDVFLIDPAKFEEASILRAANFSNLPSALLITANYDPLRDEGEAYANKLRSAGVETVYRNFENTHGFLGMGTMGQEAMQMACEFLKTKLNG
ncbi:alpha/beta hydrolase [Mucilaginibacter sp. BJC16-A38]|uniref:alpha/beta hydrolase n=1 Tax=Mucilaginibacter phenanthrenivorans TaxID=1234842 RepID=UPI002158787C|nr:alpha/beta hydrolase [Mucilaginibacter phenanthrenivorans]MCR8560814.1 alpha/beta hydrolase [Mucilaginibacter phenanthrenivorans]